MATSGIRSFYIHLRGYTTLDQFTITMRGFISNTFYLELLRYEMNKVNSVRRYYQTFLTNIKDMHGQSFVVLLSHWGPGMINRSSLGDTKSQWSKGFFLHFFRIFTSMNKRMRHSQLIGMYNVTRPGWFFPQFISRILSRSSQRISLYLLILYF